MTVSELIEMLKNENPNAVIKIQVSYARGYIESNEVELDGGSDDEVTLFGYFIYGDSV